MKHCFKKKAYVVVTGEALPPLGGRALFACGNGREAVEERDRLKEELCSTIARMGFPRELGVLIGEHLGTEKTLSRMLGYLRNVRPKTAEEIVDEMLAITADRDAWIAKKQSEFYNQKYNELLWYGLGVEEE